MLAAAPADSLVAVVGEQVILASELEQAVDFIRLADPDTTKSDSALRRDVLQRLIDDLLLQEQARKETIEVTNADVQAEVEASIAALVERFGGEEGFKQALAEEGLTERNLRQRYTDEARRKMVARRLMDKEGLTQIYISPTEAERFYNAHRDSIAFVPGRVKLAHILITITPGPVAESLGQRRITEVLDVLARGGDFAVVASSFSEDRKTAAKGGDWGWVRLAELPQEFALVLNQLKPGQISPPFRTLDGYVTLRLESRAGDRIRFRSILIRVPITRNDTIRARREAETIRARAAGGAAFDSLARAHSGDPVTADSGGYLGEFLIAGLTPPFDSVVAHLDSGEMSQPILSDHGFHIIKVLARQPERMMSYLEMQDGIRNYLYQQKLAERLRSYLNRIADRVFVRRFS
ncbi:MAG: peptidylprolyl isomerase [candidate division WOR-3 bacterium]